jgi:hypothetical protein
MIARNEEENFRANLPLWRPMISAFTCAVDDRTTDQTSLAIVESLPDVPRWVFYYPFKGFSDARNHVFREGWRKFGDNMTHFLVADPDWEPAGQLNTAELDLVHMAFQFKIFDRNMHTTRLSEWLLLAQSGLQFKYRLHEQLVVSGVPVPGLQGTTRITSFEVREVEVKGRNSWHQQEDHGHTQSYNRYLFDLALLHKDIEELPDDPHVLYYLGTTHFALLESSTGKGEHSLTDQMSQWIASGVKFLEQRCQDRHVKNKMVPEEQSWAALRWLAYAYQNFLHDFDKAAYWYERCVAFDPPRADCPTFLAKVYRSNGHVDRAWASLAVVLRSPMQERSFSNNFYIYQCSLPLEAAMTLNSLFDAEGLAVIDESRFPVFLLGWKLLRTAQKNCNSEVHGFLLESPETVASVEQAYRARAPPDSTGDPANPVSPLEVS